MREIKFRLIKDGKIVGYEDHTLMGSGICIRIRGPIDQGMWTVFHPHTAFLTHDSKDQYIGLKDKNRAEIFEGDIVNHGAFALNDVGKYGENPYENIPDGVDENDITTIFETFAIDFNFEHLAKVQRMIKRNPDVSGLEIIGNVHENLGLIKEKG